MNSKKEFSVDEAAVRRLFAEADLPDVRAVAPLGSGGFSAVYSVDPSSIRKKTYRSYRS